MAEVGEIARGMASIAPLPDTEHDVLLVRQVGYTKHPSWRLVRPLRPGRTVKLTYGPPLACSDLIGRKFLDVLSDDKGRTTTLFEPSLGTYVLNTPRLATPIYPADAASIVSLLDLNLPRPGEDEADQDGAAPFEVFEAGTGHGSLTLHLARALHAANPAVPPTLRQALCRANVKAATDLTRLRPTLEDEDQSSHETYRASRRAVLHTIDKRRAHADGAYTTVRNFNRAQYLLNIDFHAGTIAEFMEHRSAQLGGKPFLSRAVLDLPDAQKYAEPVIRAMHNNALLLVFYPSISQIAEFSAWVEQTRQPLRLERVTELATGTSPEGAVDNGGGREWSVKTVIPRNQGPDALPVQIMRPKVGDRLGGGGFVMLMRRWPDSRVAQDPEATASGTDLGSLDTAASENEIVEDNPPGEAEGNDDAR
ncbi:hypothetical protein S7711_07257 [Stachybotrys chartarum IBT 7711]|uniref:tRNA (adenine(58)-N(1))-methyltransferase catalytic subunit TRM61 n=1 Tax=Stachybotrys chartarum (strain CBS 109288 / IBT 7711) TaxID=1280523 RepID=A0A084AS88_STACB|nr:hypothetical protein S7711_07257 [Stachybotrys chartarum IBT 7711]